MSKTLRTLSVSAVAGFGWSASALADLGTFSPNEGYTLSVPSGGNANWCDVSYYNAGAYGVNAGGGSLASIVPDSGLWRVTGQVGGFFTSSAARNAAVGGAPPYPVNVPSNTVPAYIVGNHFPGRGGDGSNLALRNDTPAGTGDIKYQYSLDTFDTGGPVPSSITSGVVTTQFYFMTDPGVAPNPGSRARDKFVMSFTDSSANIGVQWGYADDNEVYWRTNTSGAWNYTGVYATSADWDGVRMDIDLSSDTFGLDYYDVGTNVWSTMVPAGTALGTPMQDMTVLGWQLADAVSTGVGGKNFFDDFSFTVPEPSTATLLLCMAGAVGLLRRR